MSASSFESLQKEFTARGYKTYCMDLPGFGSSKPPDRSLTLSDYVIFIEDYLKEKKLDKIILIGHSFGGRIGIKLAVSNPKKLSALILTGAPGINPVPRIKTLFFLTMAKIGNIIFSPPFLSIVRNMARKFLYRAARASDFYHTHAGMRETFKNVIKEDLKPYRSKINIPVLLLWGREDKIVPVGIAQKMNKLIKRSKLVIIPCARHGLPWTHPDLFVENTEKFLKEL